MLVKIFALIGGITFILVDLLDKKSRKELGSVAKDPSRMYCLRLRSFLYCIAVRLLRFSRRIIVKWPRLGIGSAHTRLVHVRYRRCHRDLSCSDARGSRE